VTGKHKQKEAFSTMKNKTEKMEKTIIQRYGHQKSARKALTMTVLKNYLAGIFFGSDNIYYRNRMQR
jgi:hypothetical protein